ncbi:predicted protein [Streptomyces sp. SPB78]|nr:predicted protein [Streptomyces sp. SPB78]
MAVVILAVAGWLVAGGDDSDSGAEQTGTAAVTSG